MTELIVRELSGEHVNNQTLAGGSFLDANNIASFFNDLPFDLDLVAVRVGSIPALVISTGDLAAGYQLFSVAEVSRQAVFGQQEGILANARGVLTVWSSLASSGGKANMIVEPGQTIIGNFRDALMTLEFQTGIYLNSRIVNAIESANSPSTGTFRNYAGATLYFRRAERGGGRRRKGSL